MQKVTLLIAFLSCSFMPSLFAQPVLTADNSNPVDGDVFVSHVLSDPSSVFTSANDTGANVIWDFQTIGSSAADTITDTIYIQSCGFIPPCGYFAGSNIAGVKYGYSYPDNIRDTSYAFFSALPGSLINLGTFQYVGAGTDTNVLSGYTVFQYPFAYHSGFGNNYIYQVGTYASIPFTGSVYSDAYGVLKLPSGVFPNVLRLHAVYDQQPSRLLLGGDTITIFNHIEDYTWYMPGFHNALLGLEVFHDSLSDNTSHTYYTATYYTQLPTSVPVVSNSNASFTIYPNPAKQQFNISFDLIQSQALSITVTDILGRSVKTISSIFFPSGMHTFTCDVSKLPPGLYFLHLQGDGLSVTKKLELQ